MSKLKITSKKLGTKVLNVKRNQATVAADRATDSLVSFSHAIGTLKEQMMAQTKVPSSLLVGVSNMNNSVVAAVNKARFDRAEIEGRFGSDAADKINDIAENMAQKTGYTYSECLYMINDAVNAGGFEELDRRHAALLNRWLKPDEVLLTNEELAAAAEEFLTYPDGTNDLAHKSFILEVSEAPEQFSAKANKGGRVVTVKRVNEDPRAPLGDLCFAMKRVVVESDESGAVDFMAELRHGDHAELCEEPMFRRFGGMNIKDCKYQPGNRVFVFVPDINAVIAEPHKFSFAGVMSWVENMTIQEFIVCASVKDKKARAANGELVPVYICTHGGAGSESVEINEGSMFETKGDAVKAITELLQRTRDKFNAAIENAYSEGKEEGKVA